MPRSEGPKVARVVRSSGEELSLPARVSEGEKEEGGGNGQVSKVVFESRSGRTWDETLQSVMEGGNEVRGSWILRTVRWRHWRGKGVEKDRKANPDRSPHVVGRRLFVIIGHLKPRCSRRVQGS